jgi:ElaB/YqjD/DUF883 family membrane-anchored ribosome-binding protein
MSMSDIKDNASKMADKASDTMKGAADKLRSGELRDAAQDTAERVRAQAGAFVKTARETAESMGSQASDIADRVTDQAGEALEDTRVFVREQPMAALLIAAGVGFALGYMLRR